MSDWSNRPQSLKPGIPATEYLTKELADDANASLVMALAAGMYRLKHGLSASVVAPFLSPDALCMTLRYLHRCRIDALSGVLRGNWFNCQTMSISQDLLVWSRASMQARKLRDVRELNLQHVGLNRETRGLKTSLDYDDRINRTVLCQPADDLAKFCEELRKTMHPFAIVIDLTPFGYREDPVHLADLMNEHFPGVPLMYMASVGDVDTDTGLCCLPLDIPIWRQHLKDKTPLVGKNRRKSWSLTCATLSDNRFCDRICHAADLARQLKAAAPSHLHKNSVSVVYRVLNALQTLSVPIEFYEQQLRSRRHGGIFPVKPLEDWIALARRTRLTTGESQDLLEQCCDQLSDILEYCKGGETGKAQAMAKWLTETLHAEKSGLLLVGSEREAKILRTWLIKDYAVVVDSGQLTVLGVASAREAAKVEGLFDRALVVGKLWKSDLWSLYLADHVTWVAYPSEAHWILSLSQFGAWGALAQPEGKEAWWSLPKKLDSLIYNKTGSDGITEETWTDCPGRYAIDPKFIVEFNEDPAWMIALFASVKEPDERLRPDEPMAPGEVAVMTDDNFYRFDSKTILQVYSESDGEPKVDDVAAENLEEGMQIILLNGDDHGMFSVMEMLIDFVTGNSQAEQMYQRMSQRWFDYVDGAIYEHGSPERLRRKLRDAGVDIGLSTVRKWSRHEGIAPQNKHIVVPAMAKLSGIQYNDSDLGAVQNAQSKVLGLHNRVGKALKAAMMAEAAGKTEITVFGSKKVPLDVLRAQYTIEEVQSVNVQSDVTVEADEALSIPDLMQRLAAESGGRIVFTPRAFKSAEKSPFRYPERVRVCVELIRDHFHKVFSQGESLEAAIDMAKPHGIEYRGNSSSITMGGTNKDRYNTRYNGKNVNFGPHFNIGDSRAPERCFRIHFHYDEDDQAVVIHHAGRHLPTSAS